MSDSSYLENLRDGVEVEWKPLGEVVDYEQPTKYLVTSKTYDDEFDLPVLTAGKTFILGYTNETTGIYEASSRPVIIFDDFTTANKWVDFDFKVKSSAMKMLKSSDESSYSLKYIYYWLNTLPSGLVDGDHKRQWIGNYSNKTIPIPPLHVQKEIVRILDAFTELTTELTNRKKQYNHYRNQLLSFEEGAVKWMELGEVVKIKTGASVNKDVIAANPGPYPVINSGKEPLGYLDQWNTENDPIGITTRGAGVGSVTWQEGKYFRGNLNYSVSIKDETNLHVRFFYHLLHHMQRQIHALCTFDGIPALNAGNLKELQIPIPPLAEQARIASILDKFDTLTHSINRGLPREIVLRQRQYAYYRDLLLSFPKPEVTA